MATRNSAAHVNFIGGVSGFNNPGARVFYVAASAALDGETPADTNNGISPQTAFSTIQKGLNSCTAARGDVVAVLPGTYTITAALTMTKADVRLVAAHPQLYGMQPNVEITTSTDSVSMIEIDADGCWVDGFHLDHNTTTANVELIDVGDTTSCSGVVIRNCWLDMVGSAGDTDGIRLGDGTQTVTNSLIENCVLQDADQDGIIISAGSDENVVRDCWIFDDVNAILNGVLCTGDSCLFERVIVQSAGTTCFSFVSPSLECVLNDCRVSGANAAGTIGVLFADGAGGQCFNIMAIAQDTGNFVDHTSDVDGNSGCIGWSADTDGTISTLLNPSISGTP